MLEHRVKHFYIVVFINMCTAILKTNEPLPEKKTYLLASASDEDSNQLAHQRNLFRVFIVNMMNLCILVYPKYVE